MGAGHWFATYLVPLALLVAGCTVAPPPRAELEAAIGAAEHPRVLARFGGALERPALQGYVEAVGASVEAVAGDGLGTVRYTVLDEASPNAFSLPGGYVYVTRGLLALVADEAELAAALAHEIAHLTAGHALQRVLPARRRAAEHVLGAVLAAEDGPPDAPAVSAELVVAQELEADRLGEVYLEAAGHDSHAMARVLRRLATFNAMASDLDNARVGFVSRRLEARIGLAEGRSAAVEPRPPARREALYAAVAGLDFGPDRRRGFVAGRTYVHLGLGIRFTLPAGFDMVSTADWAFGRDAGGLLLLLDRRLPEAATLDAVPGEGAPRPERPDPAWPVAVATTLVPVPGGDRRLRFLKRGAFDDADRRAIRLVQLTAEPVPATIAGAFRQRRIVVVEAQRGASIAQLAAGMDVDGDREALFRLINDLTTAGARLPAARPVKLISGVPP